MSQTSAPDEGATHVAKAPGLFRNYISFAGSAIHAARLVSIVLMLLLEFLGDGAASHNPYVGIFTYILFPTGLGFGLVVVVFGMLWERRRRRRLPPGDRGPYPRPRPHNPNTARTF